MDGSTYEKYLRPAIENMYANDSYESTVLNRRRTSKKEARQRLYDHAVDQGLASAAIPSIFAWFVYPVLWRIILKLVKEFYG